jgi:hypothetical protein
MSIFLAHAKQTSDEVIDDWTARASDSWGMPTVAGRDDYLKRSRALGGWNHWVRDVPTAETWDGGPLFSMIVVPVQHFDMPTVGSATETLIRNFLAAHKTALAWNPDTNEAREIEDVAGTNSDSWHDTGMLILRT